MLEHTIYPAFQLRKAAAQAANFTVEDKEHTERLEREARDEEKTIQKLCDSLGVQMYEVSGPPPVSQLTR